MNLTVLSRPVKLSLALFALGGTSTLFAQDVTFAGPSGCGTSNSSGTWTVPCDVTSITVEVYGV